MAYDKFLIAPFDSGLVKSTPPWLTPEDSFQKLNNAYLWRGRIKKRFGSRYMGGATAASALTSRFRINLGNVAPAGTFSGFVPGIKWKIGQLFSIGTDVFTVITTGAVQDMLKTGGATVATYSTTNGAYNFTGATPGTAVYFYPAEPVMGLDDYESGPVNNHPAFGFDTQFPYIFSGGSWQKATGSTTQAVFKGTDSDFFWVTNWQGPDSTKTYMFVSNFNAATPAVPATDDNMWYWTGADWHTFTPKFRVAGDIVLSARILLPFKDRFVLLNVVEQTLAGASTAYTNRCRYSAPGSPIDVLGHSWLEQDEVGFEGAGWTDAATEEAIISAEFIKDRLIVYFERSTWELTFTGNSSRPFIWQKLNSEFGTQATFSPVIFDKVILSIANVGVTACNGSNIERVDDKIPDDIFKIRTTNNGVKRIAGIRDYQKEVAYWSWPIDTQATYSDTYPAQILVYNYKNGTWAYNDDVITAWGYFEQDLGVCWADIAGYWKYYNLAWNAGVIQAQNKRVIAGNQQGFTFIIDDVYPYNAQVMQVTNIIYVAPTLTLTIVNHTLSIGDFIYIDGLNGITISGSGIYKVDDVTGVDTITVKTNDPLYGSGLIVTGTYTGGATVSRVSRIDIVSKQWNPYIKDASNFHLAKMDFCVQSTSFGEITIDYSPSSSMEFATGEGLSMITDAMATNSILGTSILETYPFSIYPLESIQDRLWHPVYFQTQGNCIQIRLYFTDAEMVVPSISREYFTLEGIMLYTKPTSTRLE